MDSAVVVRGLVKNYRKSGRGISGMDLDIEQGVTFALLGPNGAGKTTFVKCVLGLLRPNAGSITIFGVPAANRSSREGVGFVPESPRFADFLSAREVMRLHGRLIGRRLALAQALLGTPRLMVMDEPTADLDPIGRRTVRNQMADLKQAGATIILNSHLLSEVERLCDHVAIMNKGKLLGQGPIDELVPEGTDLETVFVDMVETAG
jgi:ABC-2 type transport system ATP-binding protein